MNEETWKDILAYDEPKGFKPPHWCSVLLEVTIFLLIGITAALLRFTSWATIFERRDLSILCIDDAFNKDALSNGMSWLYYTLCIVGPLLMVIVCEIERSYYSEDPNYKLFTSTQRFFYISLRPIGMFILGTFLTSAITDIIRVEVALPRPYTFSKFKEFCSGYPLKNDTLTLDERYALTSFPCHLSALSAFTSFLAACYIHNSISLKSVPLLKPTVKSVLFLLTVSASIYRVNINYNHWIDVLFGVAIGSVFAYLVNAVLLQGYKSHKEIMTENTWRLLLPRVNIPKTGGLSTIDRATVQSTRSYPKTRSTGSRRNEPYWLSE